MGNTHENCKLLQTTVNYCKTPYYKAITKHSKVFLRTTQYYYVLLRSTQD